MERIEAEERLGLDQERRLTWVQRDEKRIEQNWSIATALKAKAVEMMRWSLDGEVLEVNVLQDDGSIKKEKVIVAPPWRMRDVATYLKIANELEQVVLGALQCKFGEQDKAGPSPLTDRGVDKDEVVGLLASVRREIYEQARRLAGPPPDLGNNAPPAPELPTDPTGA